MKYFGLAVLGIIALITLYIITSLMGAVGSVATAPSRVISKTFETNNIINNYEWFHDANGQYISRVHQAAEHKQMLTSAVNNEMERNRLSIELSAIRQSCRDLATRYNANATKSNRSIFMGKEAPESLTIEGCEK